MATEDSKFKKLVDDEKATRPIWPFPWIKLSVPPNKKDSKIKNAVASDDSPINEKKEDEKKVGTDLGIRLDTLRLRPKKKLLVLPLAGIMVYRAHQTKPYTFPKNRRPDFSYGSFLVYKRPFCEDFFKFCVERFEVGLWSSARERNIQYVLTNLVGELKSKLLFTWDQEQCMDTGFMCLDNTDKPLFLKQLSHLWDKNFWNLPWRDGEYSASNTLLITDPVKTLLNPPNTAIHPRKYDPENKADDFLGPNGQLRTFLNGLAEANDVPTYVKSHPIGEPAITSSHADWGYYSKIIHSVPKKDMVYKPKIVMQYRPIVKSSDPLPNLS